MRNWMKNNWLILALLIVPFLMLAFVWNQLPEEVPTHWNIKGEADNFAPKMPGMLIMPLTALFVQVLFWIIPLIDPKKRIVEFQKTVGVFQVVMAFFFVAIFIAILMSTMGQLNNPTALILPGVIVLLGVLGNYFTRLRPNYFIGIRTPWTLESEDNWKRTHRLGGRLWVIGSIILLLLFPFVNSEMFIWVFLTGVLMMSFVPIGYSFWLFQQGKEQNG